MWKEVPRTRKKEVLSSHHVESSRPSLTTVSKSLQQKHSEHYTADWFVYIIQLKLMNIG